MSIKVLFTLLIVIVSFVSCSRYIEDGIFLKYNCNAIPDGVYYFDDSPLVVYPYDNKFYQATYIDGNIGYREPETMEYHLLNTVGGEYVCDMYVDSTGIYTVGDHVIYHMDFDGNIIDEIALPDFETFISDYSITANEKYIAICYYYNTESGEKFKNVIYVIDRATNEINTYDYKKFKDGDTLERILPTSKENEFVLVGNYQVYTFDASNGKYELLYDGVNAFEIDYSPKDNRLYFIRDILSSSSLELGSITLPEGEKNITRILELEYLFPKIKAKVEENGGTAAAPWLYDVFYTESGFIVWEQYNHVMLVKPEKVNDTGEKITVLYRNSPPVTTMLQSNYETEFGWMHGAMERMNTQFEEENKIAVNAKGYAHDKFVENLRLKLLAGDDDYDVVMLEHADELLASIINYNLYLPLETYDSISSGFDGYFDGVRDVMSYDGHIFGIPYYLTVDGFTSEDDTIDKLSRDYTLDDFWKLCEEFGSSRLMFCTKTTNHKPFYYIISSILEDGMRNGEISRDTILGCIETYMKYREAGSLNLTVPGDGPLRIIGGIGGTLEAKFLFDDREYKGLRSLPTYDGKRYFDIKSMAYINSKTKNKDFAVQYLSQIGRAHV